MNIEVITLLEVTNDGKTINLFYNDIAGLYMAFGLSAYYTTMVTDPYLSYSEEMKMPVALLRRPHINHLRQSLKKVEHTVKSFYRFELRLHVGEAGYEKWAQKVLQKHLAV